MRADRRRETERLRDALADAPRFVTLGIGPDVNAIQPARLADLRFDLCRRQLVLRVREEIQRVGVAREGTELHGIAAGWRAVRCRRERRRRHRHGGDFRRRLDLRRGGDRRKGCSAREQARLFGQDCFDLDFTAAALRDKIRVSLVSKNSTFVSPGSSTSTRTRPNAPVVVGVVVPGMKKLTSVTLLLRAANSF